MTTQSTSLIAEYPSYYGSDTDPDILSGLISANQVIYVLDGTNLKASGIVTVTSSPDGPADFFYQSKTVISGTITRLGLVTLLGQANQQTYTANVLDAVTQDQPATYWEEILDPTAQVQDTETRVYVGAPLDIVQDVLKLQGDATPTTGSTTLAVAYPGVHASDSTYYTDYLAGLIYVSQLLYVTDGSWLTDTGVVLVNDAVWFSYTSKTLITGTVYRLNGCTILNQKNAPTSIIAIANGASVSPWWDITADGMRGVLTGSVKSQDFGWELQLTGIRWNSQLEFQHASVLVQQRQYNGNSGAWTSWRDRYLGYMDPPEIIATPDGNKEWHIRARGRKKYLEIQQVSSGVYGGGAITCTYDASSYLEQGQAESRFGGSAGQSFTPDKVGDGKINTAWVSKGVPGATLLAPQPGIYGYDDGIGRWVPPINQVQQYLGGGNIRIWGQPMVKIQQVYCSGIEGDRLSRQAQTWIELYNFSQYDPEPSDARVNYSNFILENNFGQRIYLGTQNGGRSPEQYFNAQTSLIVCYDERTFRQQWPVADGVTVKQWKLCDGWFGSGTPTRERQRGAGAVFRLDPRGGWVALRVAMAGNLGEIADVSEPGDTPASTFVEPWVDFVAWGDLGAPNYALPTFYSRKEPPGNDDYGIMGTPGTNWIRHGYPWDRAPWTGAAVVPQGILPGKSIRRTGRDSITLASTPPEEPAAYSAMGGGTYAIDIDSDGTYDMRNADSDTAADWSAGEPVIGNRDALLTAEWVEATQTPFAAAVVTDHTGDTITVDDATNYLRGAIGTRPSILTDQTIADGRRIAFWYGYRDDTHFYQVEFPAAYGSPTLSPGTLLTQYIDVTNGGSSRPIYEAVNIKPIVGVRWAVYTASGNTPYPTKYRIRVTGWSDPADHQTYLGDSFQWREVVHVENNTATQGYHEIHGENGAPLFVRKLVFEIDEMSDGGKAALSELELLPIPDNSDELVHDSGGGLIVPLTATAAVATAMTANRIQTWRTSDVADKVLAKAGVPKAQRFCVGGPAVRQIRVSTGTVGEALRDLAKRSGCLWGESRMTRQLFGPDPRTNYGTGRITPRIVIDPSVARDRVRMREAAHFQVSQVQLTARDDVAGLDYVVNWPPSPWRFGSALPITDRYAGSAAEALAIAQNIDARANRGHTVEVNVGGWCDYELLDIARIDNLLIDEAGVYINARDYWIQGAREEFGAFGQQVTLTLEERHV